MLLSTTIHDLKKKIAMHCQVYAERPFGTISDDDIDDIHDAMAAVRDRIEQATNDEIEALVRNELYGGGDDDVSTIFTCVTTRTLRECGWGDEEIDTLYFTLRVPCLRQAGQEMRIALGKEGSTLAQRMANVTVVRDGDPDKCRARIAELGDESATRLACMELLCGSDVEPEHMSLIHYLKDFEYCIPPLRAAGWTLGTWI
jgi:hypothetical protein